MRSLWDEAVRILADGGHFILAGVVARNGSSPARPGAVMLVDKNGIARGTVGGGPLEATVIEAARDLLAAGDGKILHFDFGGDAAAAGMVCGGTAEIVLDRVTPADLPVFAAIREDDAAGEQGSLLFMLDRKPRLLKHCRRHEQVEAEWAEAIRLPLPAGGRLFIFGCGHVGVETALLASRVDFDTVALDDRGEFTDPARFPGSQTVTLASFESIPDLGIGADSYVVIVTRGHQHDITVLDRALRAGAGYIGMIGSRRKREITRARLVELGHDPDVLARVHSPIGLEIGAETPAEIAVSIVAELIRERVGRRV